MEVIILTYITVWKKNISFHKYPMENLKYIHFCNVPKTKYKTTRMRFTGPNWLLRFTDLTHNITIYLAQKMFVNKLPTLVMVNTNADIQLWATTLTQPKLLHNMVINSNIYTIKGL